MARKEYVVEEVAKMMRDHKHIRNVGIIAHVHHGKTSLTDSLLARAGLISKSVAGDVLYTNYEEIEKDRRMTIKSAYISFGFNYNNEDYIINLIDTPGHVDFGGHVTRAMRAIDGVILVVDPTEGIMPQTETVLRQAMKEKAKPVLFFNKVDRLITELRLTPEQTQERLLKLINEINQMIETYAPEGYGSKWKVSVEKGSVAFGSALRRWAISKKIMEKNKVTFKHIFELTANNDLAKLQEICPIDEATLAMVVEHLPNPAEAQPYRIPQIWHGDLNSPDGKDMVTTNITGKTNGVIFGIKYDQQAGEIAVGRIFSGTAKKGLELHISGRSQTQKLQQVGIYMGPDKVIVDEIPAGNIAALIGMKDLSIGDTISEELIEPFEQIKHYSQHVVTKAIEAKDSRDTTKLIEALRMLTKEDLTLKAEINQDTGEHLISGMGELHLETIETKLKNDFKVPITTSEPIVVYHETIAKKVGPVEGKSPNRHSRFYVTVEPLPEGVQKAIDEGQIRDGKPKGQNAIEAMVAAGLDRAIAKEVEQVTNKCMLADVTKGVQYMNEVMELLIDGFNEAVKDGPLAREKCSGILVSIVDATIHEDPVHRGPAQIIPAIKRAIYAGLLTSGVMLEEPKQNFTINIPLDFMSDVISFLQGRRGQILNIEQESGQASILAKLPVSEVIKDFSNDLRGMTQGKAIWSMEFSGYERLPTELQNRIVREIRKRKGQPEEPPTAQQFMD
jgi:elongation factor 2